MKRFRLFSDRHWQPRIGRYYRGLWASLLAASACFAGRGLATAQDQRAMLLPVGRAGGLNASEAVAVVGDRAYVASGAAGLAVFDLSDPAVPRLLGSLDTPGAAQAVHVVGTTAYVADGDAGLQIIDVANPAAPVRLGGFDTPGLARAVQVVDGIAYVADQTAGLQVISVTNSAAPVRMGSRDTPDWALAVQVVGNYAYVGDDTTGLLVMEISNPAAPTLRRTMTVQGWVTGLQVVGNRCFVTSHDGLTVFDVSTPASPVRMTFVSQPGGFGGISVAGQHAAVSRRNGGLDVFDVSNPAAPRQLLLEPGKRAVKGLQAVGPRLFSTDAAGLWIEDLRLGLTQTFDLSPLLAGDVIALNVPIPLPATASSGLPASVQITGPAVLDAGVLTVTNLGKVSVELWQPGNDAYLPVRELRQFNVPEIIPTLLGKSDLNGGGWNVQVAGNFAYVAGAGLSILDISNPALPVRRGGFGSPGPTWDLQVVGNLAYLADDTRGLQIIDVSNSVAPTRTGIFNSSGTSYGLQVVGGLAYLADGEGGLEIVDVSNPAAPVRRGRYPAVVTPGYQVYDLRVEGHLAYLATASNGLEILDVTNPAAPVLLGKLDLPGALLDLQVDGNLAYVTTGFAARNLHIVDVANPAQPAPLGQSQLPGNGRGIQVVGQLAYVAAEWGGLRFFDIPQFGAPATLHTHTGTTFNGVHVVGNRAYLATAQGLQIVEIAFGQRQMIYPQIPDNHSYVGGALPLASTSSSGMPLNYSVISGPGSIVGDGLVATGFGRITVRMQQPGGSGYLPVTLDRTVNIGLPALRATAAADAVDLTWPAGLNGLFLDGRESMAAEHPWRPVALPWHEANGQTRVAVESSPFQFFRLRGYSGQGEPLELTGWNRDVVLENATPSRATAFSSYGSAWFESGLGGRLDGLPTNRTFLSRVTPEVLFQFQPYTGFNTLWLNNARRTNSLVLVTPSACSKLFVLAHSAGGGGNGTLRVHYADGTSSAPVPFFAPDWWDGSPASPTRRPAIQGLAWSTTVASFTYDRNPPGFSFHQTDIDLSTGPNAGKVITRLEFVKPATPEVTGIYAVSGIEVAPTP